MFETRWTDPRMENVVGGLLRSGVSSAAIVVLGGGVLFLIRHGLATVQYAVFHGEPAPLKSMHGAIALAFSGHAQGIIQTGLLLLIATPVARVAFCIWGFARERDYLYVCFSALVLAILVFSLLSGSH